MKLKGFQNVGFEFSLMFENGETITTNLNSLIGKYVSEGQINSARIDSDWGCLEFCNGAIDIDPTTLYRYAAKHNLTTC